MHADDLTPSVGTMMTKFWIGSYLILSKTKWPPFHRRYFRMHFVNEIYCMMIEISLKCVPKGPIGLAPNWRQAIIWTNADPIRWRIYVALREYELKGQHVTYIT